VSSPRHTLAVLLALLVPSAALAQAKQTTTGGIYTCTDSNGRRLTADRPIAACAHKEQQLLNKDGSLRAIIPPTLTADERTEQEARDRAAAEARAAQNDAMRRDRNLVTRFPNEAAHQRAREAAADTVRLAMKATELRLRELQAERKPLRDEAEFYLGKPLPPKLKAQMDANEAAVEAQRNAAANQEAELVRINRIYDIELERLRRLWGGAQPGTLGPMAAPPAPAKAGGGSATGATNATRPPASAPR
jgi:hypothetical protein